MMTLICLDLDGTLVRSHRAHVLAFNGAFRNNGLEEVDGDTLESFFGLAGSTIVKKVHPGLSDEDASRISDEHSRLLIEKYLDEVRAINGVKEALEELRARGYKLALLSNSLKRSMVPLAGAGGIDAGMFDVIVGRDDVARPKPAPDELRKAMDVTGERDAVMVGDTVYDMQAGKLAGAKTVAVLSGYQKREQLEKEHPDYILESAAELVKVLD